jgi:hypothetical protein
VSARPLGHVALRRWIPVLLGFATLLGCAGSLPAALPPDEAASVGFSFPADTFAFPNQVRALNPGAADLYANYCFVLARGLRQFFEFARFDPEAPRLDHDAYVLRLHQVFERGPWVSELPTAERVVVPGYPDLREFSRAEEGTVKEALGGRFWTLVHWTNWRVTFPVTRSGQETVARESMDEIRAHRLVQFLVTRWPTTELNHSVVAYAFQTTDGTTEFTVWDPNDPAEPGIISFDWSSRRFFAERFFDVRSGPIRVFRMYYSPLL